MVEKEKIKTSSLTSVVSYWKSPYYDRSQWQPYNPDDLLRKFGGNKALDKYDEMKRDDTVKAALFAKKSAVMASGWRIDPATEDDEKDKEIAQFVDDNFRHWFTGSFDNALTEILSAMEYGFSVTEKIYEIQDGAMYLKELKTQPPHSFEFEVDEHGTLKKNGLKQNIDSGMIELPIQKFIIYTHNASSGNPYGNSDLRAAYRSWFSKDIIIKFWNIFLERFGMPVVVAKYKRSASKDNREDLQDMLDNLQSKTSFTIPEDAEIEFKEAMHNAGADYDKAISMHNNSIRNSILMPKGLGFGDAEGGSYAKSKIEKDVFIWVVQPVRNQLEAVLNSDQMIRQLVDLNFPNVERYPSFRFNPISEEDKNEKAKTVIEAVAKGSITPGLEIENHLRMLLGIPEKEEEDIEEVEEIEEELKEFKLKLVLPRALTQYEKKVNFAFIKSALVDDVDEGILELKGILSKMRDDFTTQIVRKRIMEDQNVGLANKMEFRYIRDFGLMIEGILRKAETKGVRSSKDTRKRYLKSFSLDYAQTANKVGLVKGKASMWIKEQSKIVTGRISGNVQRKVKDIINDGLKRGASTADVVAEVENEFGKWASIESVDGAGTTSGRLYTEINTAYAKAFAVGMGEYNKELELSGDLVAYQFSAVLDDATTAECSQLDGQTYGAKDPIWNSIDPPRHWNCRSVKIEVYKEEAWKTGKIIVTTRGF